MYDDEESLFECLEGDISFNDWYHDKQQTIHDDPSNFRVVIGGRRCGKSSLFGPEMIEVADQFPGRTVPYAGPTVGRARDVIMPIFDRFRDEHGVKLHYNLSDHKVYTPNGGCIQIFGLSTYPDVQKGRGGSYPAFYADECGHIAPRLLRMAVQETFGPATKDFLGRGGRGIMLGGTPQHGPKEYWERVCGGNSHVSEMGASVHHMTIWDNPFYRGREAMVIAEYLRENKLTVNSAPVQREWYGRFVLDHDGLAYPHWTGKVWPIHLMPMGGYTVLGVDLGSDHPCAWVVVRFQLVERVIGDRAHYVHHGHVLETYEESGLTVHDVAAITKRFQSTYSVGATYADSAGGGKLTVDTVNDVMSVPMMPVQKAGYKEDRIWMTDSMLGNGTLHVFDRCETLTTQLATVPRERKKNGRLDHMDGYPDHSCDALHYALLGARQHEMVLDLPPRPGSKEWAQAQQKSDRERMLALINQRRALA